MLKVRNTTNFESYYSLKSKFVNNRESCSNFICFESFIETNSLWYLKQTEKTQ